MLGSQEFVERLREQIKGDRREQTETRALEQKMSWEEIVRAAECVKGEKWEEFCNRHGDFARDGVFYLARRRGRMSLRDLAEKAGNMEYAAVGAAVSRFSRRLKERSVERWLRCMGDQLSNI